MEAAAERMTKQTNQSKRKDPDMKNCNTNDIPRGASL